MLSVFKVQHDHSQTYLKPILFKLRDLVAWSLWKKDKEGKLCITLEGTQTLTQAHLNSETFSLPARISWKVADLKFFKQLHWLHSAIWNARKQFRDMFAAKTTNISQTNVSIVTTEGSSSPPCQRFQSSTIRIQSKPYMWLVTFYQQELVTVSSFCFLMPVSILLKQTADSGHLHRTTGSTMWQLVGPTQIVILDHFGYFNTNISSLEQKSFGVIPQHAQLSTQPRATSTESTINPETPLAVFLVWPAWLPGCVW